MIKPQYKVSFFFIIAFAIFWIGFTLISKINQRSKEVGDFKYIYKRGIIRVCGEEDMFSFYKDGQGYHGFHYELAKAFADKYKLKLEYIEEPDFKERIKLLKSGKCDIISGPLPVIAELRKFVTYTNPILESKLVLIQRKKDANYNPIRDQIALKEKSISVSQNSPNIQRLRNLANEISDSIYIKEHIGYSTKDLMRDVAKGTVDFAVCDKYIAEAFLKYYPGVDIETPIGFTQFQAWAIKPENKNLLDSLNHFFAEYKKSPAFERLLQKYSKYLQ